MIAKREEAVRRIDRCYDSGQKKGVLAVDLLPLLCRKRNDTRRAGRLEVTR